MKNLPNEIKAVLRQWLEKFDVSPRWPCPECGRESADDPLRTVWLRVNGDPTARHMRGCTLCNVDSLVARTKGALSEEVGENETWNTCPECGRRWKDTLSTLGIIHRTRLCFNCA